MRYILIVSQPNEIITSEDNGTGPIDATVKLPDAAKPNLADWCVVMANGWIDLVF